MSKVKPEKLSISFIVVLGLLQTFQAFSQDPYLASGPTIAHDFGVDLSAFQLTISALTIGLGLGQLVAGPLSDSLGRRLPLLVSLGLYVLASAICSISPNLAFFVLARVAQGIAGAALMVVANAVMRDLFEGLKLIHLMGRVLLVQGAAWMIGPFSGSLLLQFTDWRGICLTFGALALVLGVFTFKLLPETLPSEARKKQDLRAMPKRFASLFKDRVYVGLLIVNTFNSIGVYLYILCLPIIYTQGYGVSAADLGIFLALGSFGAYVGVQVGAKLATKVASQWLLLILLAAYIAIGIAHIAISGAHPSFGLVLTLVVIWLFIFGATNTPIGALSLSPHPEEAGTASALMGTVGLFGAALAGPYFTTVSKVNTGGVGLTLVFMFSISIAVMLLIIRPWSMKSLK
ncbi:MAG: hypothetical protein RL556_58 [Actinomycetota bacterium]|jgi:DHA1 family bicyclomycin/chloramphenicol resistance-like MFS transporter